MLHDVTQWELEGQLLDASNAVFRMRPADAAPDDASPNASLRAVYKPIRGERPLRDFPRGTLAHREVATYLVAQAGGWDQVPQTQWYDGPFGPGSMQRWVGPLEPEPPTQVGLQAPSEVDGQDGQAVIAAFETDDGPALLTHSLDDAVADIAVLDIITNNADRKGSHLITDGGSDAAAAAAAVGTGRVRTYAIDNGLTFHVDDKLRTVLWGWAGQPLPARVISHLTRLQDGRAELAKQLSAHLSDAEIRAFTERTDALLQLGEFPQPPEDRYALPWPPL